MGLLKSKRAAPGPPSMAQAQRERPTLSAFSSQSSHHTDALQRLHIDLPFTCMLSACEAISNSVIALPIMPPLHKRRFCSGSGSSVIL